MKTIQLKPGIDVIVDADDFNMLNTYTWWLCKTKTKRAVKTQLSAQTTVKGKTVKMHRLIMQAPLGVDVDHINGNPLDNRKANLRICSRSENLMNAGKYTRRNKCSSKYKGVSWHKATKKWEAGLQVNGKRKWLGLFLEEQSAAVAYNLAALKYFGQFANLNVL